MSATPTPASGATGTVPGAAPNDILSDSNAPGSPGPYALASAVGPAAVLQLQHGHFLITMNVTTTFPPAAVLPTVYSLLPASQLQCDHIDIQTDEKTHRMRVQVVGVNPINNPHAVSTLASRLKALQPGASVTVHKELSQLSVDVDSISAVSSLLQSSQSRALLDTHVQYYRLHSHPAFMPSLLIYINTPKVDHVLNVMRNFMADPIAHGAIRPPRPAGLEVKGDEIPPAASAAAATNNAAAAPVTPEKPPQHRTVQSSSRSPHFKPNSTTTVPPVPVEPPAAASSSHSHEDTKPAVTSVTETTPIRLDHKWWVEKRADLIALTGQYALAHDSLYVYNLAQVRSNVRALKQLSNINRVFYACKANNNVEVLRTIESLGVGFECVSIQELKFIRSLFPDLPKDRLLFTPNFAAKFEYEEAYFYTDFVTLDNIYPLDHWPDLFRNKTVLIRMDPGQGLGYHAHVQTGGARSKFGVSVEQLQNHLGVIKNLGIQVIGLHVHKGSGIHDATAWARTAQFLSQFLPHFPSLQFLDLGGGLGVNYRDSDPVLDLDKLNAEIGTFRASLPASATNLQLWLEPGRFIVANSGVLLSSVTQLKNKPGRNFVGIATGMNSLIRPALYESYHEIVNLSRLDEMKKEDGAGTYLDTTDANRYQLVDVVGPICETGDVLGKNRALPASTSEGDIILIDTAGAYGRVMSSEYNLKKPALEVVLKE